MGSDGHELHERNNSNDDDDALIADILVTPRDEPESKIPSSRALRRCQLWKLYGVLLCAGVASVVALTAGIAVVFSSERNTNHSGGNYEPNNTPETETNSSKESVKGSDGVGLLFNMSWTQIGPTIQFEKAAPSLQVKALASVSLSLDGKQVVTTVDNTVQVRSLNTQEMQ
jgi:hypothetical protein